MLGKNPEPRRGNYEPELTMPDSIESSSAFGLNKPSSQRGTPLDMVPQQPAPVGRRGHSKTAYLSASDVAHLQTRLTQKVGNYRRQTSLLPTDVKPSPSYHQVPETPLREVSTIVFNQDKVSDSFPSNILGSEPFRRPVVRRRLHQIRRRLPSSALAGLQDASTAATKLRA